MSIEKLSTNASLKEVIDKFEEISFKDFSSIDIITASKLPTNGKEGQLCIITEVKPSKIYFDYVTPALSESEIFIQYFMLDSYDTFTVKDNLSNINLKIRNIVQNKNGKTSKAEGFIYKNNVWKSLLRSQIDLYNNGEIDDSTGDFAVFDTVNDVTLKKSSNYMTFRGDCYNTGKRYASGILRHNRPLDFAPYRHLFVDVDGDKYVYRMGGKFDLNLRVYTKNGDVVADYKIPYALVSTDQINETWTLKRQTLRLDVSNINIDGYVGFYIDMNNTASTFSDYVRLNIYRISLGDEVLE